MTDQDWRVYTGTGAPRDAPVENLPKPPPWRVFPGSGQVQGRPADDGGETSRRIGKAVNRRHLSTEHEVAMVNAAIYLRRPLLVTGRPGTGKSSLAYLIASELGLGPVLRWPIGSRTMLKDGLYSYDAIGRVQAASARPHEEPDIGEFVHLGPLGTALLPYDLPRVLLVDELDKGDIDLPNDLLNAFEEGEYRLDELVRISKQQPEVTVLTDDWGGTATITGGRVQCRSFPIVIITSNGEREFPPALLRRCLQLHLEPPDEKQLGAMVAAQFGPTEGVDVARLISEFLHRSDEHGGLAADQLLNAVHLAVELVTAGVHQPADAEWKSLLSAIWHPLQSRGA